MKIDILNISGQKSGKTAELPDAIFAMEPNDHAIYLTVKQFMANQRQGTHKSKEKSEVSGSTRKLMKQKGSGGARKGSIKNPMFRGGGRIFGPKPHLYGFKLNSKVKELARKSALTYKAKENGITVLEDFKLETTKTKEYFNILKNLGVEGKKTILVLAENDAAMRTASKNIPNTKILTAANLNTYEVMNANQLLFVESSLKTLSIN